MTNHGKLSRPEGPIDERAPLISDAVQETDVSNAAVATAEATPIAVATSKPPRQIYIDLTRGLLMVFMAVDHSVVMFKPWQHGQGLVSETPYNVVVEWNSLPGFIGRSLSHLCAPGFSFLLGVGIAFFVSSRSERGWSMLRLIRHFAVRALAIIAVNQILFAQLGFSSGIWILNTILLCLAVDYLFVGASAVLLQQVVEPSIARVFAAIRSRLTSRDTTHQTDDLRARAEGEDRSADPAPEKVLAEQSTNITLFALSIVTLFWNVWLWPSGLRCVTPLETFINRVEPMPIVVMGMPVRNKPYVVNLVFDFFFYEVYRSDIGIISVFPPFAFLSFVLFGLLYGRVMLARKWKVQTIAAVNLALGAIFAALFVSTRVLQWGNLAHGCLQTDEQGLPPVTNQYLSGWHSFFYETKYPPSPAFAFYAMSGIFFFLGIFALMRNPQDNPVLRVLLLYGTNALFFFAVHLVLLGLLAAIFVHGKISRTLPWDSTDIGINPPDLVFVFWALALALLVPACRAYSKFKARKGPDSVWRFF